MIALLVLREWDAGPVSLWPLWEEWKIGLLWFAIAIVPSCLLAFGLHSVVFHPVPGPWWRVALTGVGLFVGYFCVMIGEELFFRGVVERALLALWRSPLPAIILSALCFGAVHLWFRGFPDWQWAVVTSLLGLACGFAYAQTGSIRASLVTHTLTIVTWRLLFR
jgi:membrane protease YdiL (CAAX protease family)